MNNEIPNYQQFMFPLLRALGDAKVYQLKDLLENIATELKITFEQRKQMLPSGRSTVFYNRLSWAKTYLKKAGLIIQPAKGQIQISKQGKVLLKSKPSGINVDLLTQFPDFMPFYKPRTSKNKVFKEKKEALEEKSTENKKILTPEQQIEESYNQIKINI